MSDETSLLRDRAPIETQRAIELLIDGDVSPLGRMPYSSNATFLVEVSDNTQAQGIYKPTRGERPLWDFPHGLAHREVATFLIDQELGWGLIPPTVARDDLPFGYGSLQLFMPAKFEEHYFTLAGEERLQPQFRRLCALDVVINSTDRKSGHCLLGTDDTIWAIDNGLTFHAEFKLRTVIWDFASEPLPTDVRADLQQLLDNGLPEAITETLSPLENAATLTRTQALVDAGHFPAENDRRSWPWPLV